MSEVHMFKSVSCVAVYATDIDRSRDFYTGTLGFRVAADLGGLCFLKSASGAIDVYLESVGNRSGAAADSARLGFFLTSEGPVQAAMDRLRGMGVRVLEDSPVRVDDHTGCFRFADPDGNLIDVSGLM